MPEARRDTIRRTAATAMATATAAVASLALTSSASAHDTSHCYHGDIPNGGWYTAVAYHYTTGTGAHYNVYDHYLYGYYQHTESNLCN